jgi:hypothetical protein
MITLSNQTEATRVYTQIATGSATLFPTVWKGTYTIEVLLAGHNNAIRTNVSIQEDGSISIEMTETIRAPFSLGVSMQGSSATLTWNQTATIVLAAGDVWGDGTGYQMLLDNTATLYGNVIPEEGPLAEKGTCVVDYSPFSHKIPENAIGNCNTNTVVFNGSASIDVPAGVYDYAIVNPVPEGGNEGNTIWIAAENGRKKGYVFEAGKKYTFTVAYSGGRDNVTIDIENVAASSQKNNSKALNGFTVYLDGEQKATGITEMAYTFTDLTDGTYTAGVEAVYTTGTSTMETIQFTMNQTNIQVLNRDLFTVYPNPVSDDLHIETDRTIKHIEMVDLNGRVVKTWFGDNKTINVQSIPAGHYILRIHTENSIVPVRIVKQ